MSGYRVEILIGALGIALGGLTVLRWQHALDGVDSDETASAVLSRHRTTPLVDEDSVIAAAYTIAQGDPFRLSNAPASVAFSPGPDASVGQGTAPVPAPVRLRPALSLKGIIGGPPWQAIVDGIPGQAPGVVVRAGMEFDKLVIRTISRDTVLVQGPDTSWKLTLGRASP